MEEYRKRVPPTLAKYGGRFLVRGGAHHTVEGDWEPNRLVILECPSLEQAKRRRAGRASLIMVEGVA